MWIPILTTLLAFVSIFLIILVLIQRGRGGGLAGALGGMGGQSAFGTRAGDVYTRVTIGAVIVWILLCILILKIASPGPPSSVNQNQPSQTQNAPAQNTPAGNTTPAGTTPSGTAPAAPASGAPAAPTGGNAPAAKP
ncbi:MAG: preprotein translocase subunit SecG [Planctomycetia bacterium]|nr:preprotein translocase subunit SecG [Planctomycetia bacterium]